MSSVKKVVITGASGFLGRHLTERLKDDERYSVTALSSRPEELERRIGGRNVTYLHKDAVTNEHARDILADAVVVCCAYPRNTTGTAVADGLRYIQKTFESAVTNGAKAIINISSQSVYSSQREEAAAEDSPLCLESPYAVGKYAVELMLESICRSSQTAYTSVRMASLIGPGFDQRIVNRFVKQALEKGTISAKENEQRFGFFDVEDAVSGLTAMIGSDESRWKTVYNLGSEKAYSLVEIADIVRTVVKESCGTTVGLEVVPGDERASSQLCAKRFAEDFAAGGWKSLYESVREICTAELSRK